MRANATCSSCRAEVLIAGDAGDVRRVREHATKCAGTLRVTITHEDVQLANGMAKVLARALVAARLKAR